MSNRAQEPKSKSSKRGRSPGEQRPAKRMKIDLNSTFVLDVGNKPNRERFTVHHDLITKRSEYFRAARSSQWIKNNKRSRLPDDDPTVFSDYVHYLYFGTDDLEAWIQTDVTKEWAAKGDRNDNATLEGTAMEEHLSAMRRFIDLYILCDKVLDPISANSMIDKLVSFTSKQNWRLNSDLVIHIYVSTADGNPLRWLACDWYMHDGTHMWPLTLPVKQWAGLPRDFLCDLLVGYAHLQRVHPEGQVRHVFADHPELLEKGYYHQEVYQGRSDA